VDKILKGFMNYQEIIRKYRKVNGGNLLQIVKHKSKKLKGISKKSSLKRKRIRKNKS
jgi:hypothetical protein